MSRYYNDTVTVFLVLKLSLCQDFHSPSSARRTRSVANMEETAVDKVVRASAGVSVSSDSPEKIRNFDSPGRPKLSKEAVGNIVATFKKGLAF